MSYDFSDVESFTLATTNESEIKEIRDLIARGGMQPVVWVIEGVDSSQGYKNYYLREVFHPTSVRKAKVSDTPGARKQFEYFISGTGKRFEMDILLNDHVWFDEFLFRNGNFGFGLDNLRDEQAKSAFLDIARPFFVLK